VAPGFNRAPQPFIDVNRATIVQGQAVQFTAAASTDPGGNIATTTVEWDIDGDGVFDTGPTTTKVLNRGFLVAGDYRVRARLTDAQGASSISAPLVVRVAASADFDYDGAVDGDDLAIWSREYGRTTGGTHALGDADGDGVVDGEDFAIWQRQVGSYVTAAASTSAVAAPEPASLTTLVIALGAATVCRLRRRQGAGV
jgi:hypothetical protein